MTGAGDRQLGHASCGAHSALPHSAFRLAPAGEASGFTLLELMFVLTLSVTAGAVAAPPLLAAVDEVKAAGAARYVATKLQQTRMEAVARSADVGWQFVGLADGYTYAPYIDGNGNGIRTRDIQRGADSRIGPIERLTDHFPGVEFGAVAGLPPIDPGGSPPGSDPIRLGTGNILTFTPLGTSTSGTVYLRGRRDVQYAIRVLGETGKARVLKFDRRVRQWKPA